MKITSNQVRAARALLRMSQKELAEHVGLAVASIRRIEDDSVQPRESTLNDLLSVFTKLKLEFLDNDGVRFRPEGVEVLHGKDGLSHFLDKIYGYAQMSPCTLRHIGIEESLFDKCAPDIVPAHRKRMSGLVHARHDIFVRAILREGDQNLVCTNYAEYRWYPSQIPPPVPYYLFGDSVGIFAMGATSPLKIIMITSPVIAQVYRAQFDSVWDVAQPPRLTSHLRLIG